MNLFKRAGPSSYPAFDLSEWTPVIRCSICTGEKSACMQNKKTGKILELKLLRSSAELDRFCSEYGTSRAQIKTVY